MKKILSLSLFSLCATIALAEQVSTTGPDGRLRLQCSVEGGRAAYSITYDGKQMVTDSPLGFTADAGNFQDGLQYVKADSGVNQSGTYSLTRIKANQVSYAYNRLVVTVKNAKGHNYDIEFRVGNNDVALRYNLPAWGNFPNGQKMSIRILEERTSFTLPRQATSFLTPQSNAMIGWKGTKPSYEEEYNYDAPLSKPSAYGKGYTFPALFRVGNDGWVLLSETDVDSRYCASRLSEVQDASRFQITFPMPGENNGNGTSEPAMSLPNTTPWRTITVGKTLKPIVETTVMWDHVEPRYEPTQNYRFGKSTWSWIVWQDNSINYNDLKEFIDLAHTMGYPYSLIDCAWDVNLGKEKMEQLVRYGKSRGVDLFLWYSSSGWWNDITQSPINIMSNGIKRKQAMRWLQQIGVKGIKVDFFGGDKQETMRLYEDILSDANDHGLMVIFHGCTLPRGWERMYPNFVGAEAVLASENVFFTQAAADNEARATATHPFIRNTVASMDWGGSFLNRTINKGNDPTRNGSKRRTTDVHELAQAVLFQSPIQNFAITPENLNPVEQNGAPRIALDFMRDVPTTWKQTRFVEGYPGEYIALERVSEDNVLYLAATNAGREAKTLKLTPTGIQKGQKVLVYSDNKKTQEPELHEVVYKGKPIQVSLATGGGAVLVVR